MSTERSVLHRLVEESWAFAVAASACSVVLGAYIGRTGSLMPLVALVAIGAVTVAITRPTLALAFGLTAMALPYTWGPQVAQLGFGSGIVVGLLFLTAYATTLTHFRPTALDLAVFAFALTPAAIAAFQGLPFHFTHWLAPTIMFPYLGFRLLFHSTDAVGAFAPAVVAIGVIVALIAVWEGFTGHNPVVEAGTNTFSSGGHYVTTWNVPDVRGGHLRALSTFGHPIALGMFLLIPLAFALARGGTWHLAAAGVILIAVALTFSRGAWVGCLVVVVLLAGRGRGRIVAVATTLIAAAGFVGPVHRLLVESSSATTQVGQTADYRVGLLEHAIQGVSLLGHPFTDLQSAIPNFVDITSLIAGTAVETGLLGLIELALVACLAIVALVDARRRGDQDYRAATAALTAQLIGLTSVALITNYQFFFWALLAYVATRRQISVRRLEDRSA
jgi:hypothetical protein